MLNAWWSLYILIVIFYWRGRSIISIILSAAIWGKHVRFYANPLLISLLVDLFFCFSISHSDISYRYFFQTPLQLRIRSWISWRHIRGQFRVYIIQYYKSWLYSSTWWGTRSHTSMIRCLPLGLLQCMINSWRDTQVMKIEMPFSKHMLRLWMRILLNTGSFESLLN